MFFLSSLYFHHGGHENGSKKKKEDKIVLVCCLQSTMCIIKILICTFFFFFWEKWKVYKAPESTFDNKEKLRIMRNLIFNTLNTAEKVLIIPTCHYSTKFRVIFHAIQTLTCIAGPKNDIMLPRSWSLSGYGKADVLITQLKQPKFLLQLVPIIYLLLFHCNHWDRVGHLE